MWVVLWMVSSWRLVFATRSKVGEREGEGWNSMYDQWVLGTMSMGNQAASVEP